MRCIYHGNGDYPLLLVIGIRYGIKLTSDRMKAIIKGDIFCVNIDNYSKCYLQYVTDETQMLNSSFIRVFKKRYSMDETPQKEDIVKDEISFYAHTMIKVGVKQYAWHRMGNSKSVGDTVNITFRWFGEMDFSRISKSFSWRIWRVNKPATFIGELNEQVKKYDLGLVIPPCDIMARIKRIIILTHIAAKSYVTP